MRIKHTITSRYKAGFVFLIFIFLFALAGLAQENADEYKKTIEMADSYFTKGDYINAKASYQIAVRLAPEDQYPKDRLQQSLDLIRQQMYQNSLYQQKIQVADDLLEKNDLEAAIKVFQEALVILPGDSYAAGKVQEISNNMVDAKLLEENFQNSIIKGDQLLKEGKLENALTEYRNASSLKPAETYPKEKAGQVEKLLAEKKAITGDYDSFLQTADLAISRNKYDEAIINLEQAIMLKPDETIPKQKLAEAQNLKTAWESYAAIINDADNLYISKDFEKAKEKYLQAQSIMPADEYPKRMLEKIDIALMDLSKANRSSYEFVIALADKLFNQQDYEQAIVEYNSALRFKPDEAYARQRISDINNALSLRKTQEEAYVQSIAKADEQYKEQLYEEARDEYTRATGIKPLEQYPKVKVEEINTLLSNLASQRGVYDNLIKGADRLFFSDEYVEAREQYRKASDLFPKEQYPRDQITMIDEILGIRDKYVKAVTKADQLLYDRKYDEAMLEFRNAAGINPEEAYPLQKIKEIETIMAFNANQQKPVRDQNQKVLSDEGNAMTEEEYQEAIAAYQKEKVFEISPDSAEIKTIAVADQKYQNIIAAADSSLVAEDYQKALTDYKLAMKLKPGEVYAEGKITKINGILSEITAKDALERQQEAMDKQYADVISGAEIAFQAKDYQKALTTYQSALNLKPNMPYVQGKINEINRILSEIAAQEAIEKQKEIDINRTLETLAAQRDQAYQLAISKADNYFDQQNYDMAKLQYDRALELKPDELYPLDKMKVVNEQIMKKKQIIQEEYDKTITDADRFYTSKIYDNAIDSYRASSALNPEEEYPKEMIRRILKLLSERSVVQINKDPLLIANNTQHKFEFVPVPVKDRKSNYIFFRARNVSKVDYKLIISFGKDQIKNGGIVIKVPAGEDLYEFVVRISAQYKWFSDDNNWITFYPEGGDFEVSLLQISYSD